MAQKIPYTRSHVRASRQLPDMAARTIGRSTDPSASEVGRPSAIDLRILRTLTSPMTPVSTQYITTIDGRSQPNRITPMNGIKFPDDGGEEAKPSHQGGASGWVPIMASADRSATRKMRPHCALALQLDRAPHDRAFVGARKRRNPVAARGGSDLPDVARVLPVGSEPALAIEHLPLDVAGATRRVAKVVSWPISSGFSGSPSAR